jgi:uncharacterized GH25 family protein
MPAFRALACASLCLVLHAAAVTAAAAPPSEATAANNELHGVVVDEAGKPVAHATVAARGYRVNQSTQSGADGSFAMKIAAKGMSWGLLHATDQAGKQGFVQVLIGQKSNPVRIVLKKPREITVTVTDKSGNAIQGATVGASVQNAVLVRQETDAQGQALLRLPEGLASRTIFAMKAGVGFDYVESGPAKRKRSQAADKDDNLKFVFTGARTVTVRVTDRAGKPIAGVELYPWYFNLPKKGQFNMTGVSSEELFTRLTDQQGVATFPFVPTDNQGKVTFWMGKVADYAPLERPTFDPQSKSDSITTVMAPLERVRGKVMTAEGRPAVAAEVKAYGVGYDMNLDDFQGSAKCDSHGNFELRVPPNKYYTFSARRDRAVAPLQNRTILLGEATEPLNFVLKPGQRVYGQVTRARDKTPFAHGTVSLSLNPSDDYSKLPKSQQLPNPRKSRRWIGPQFSENAETDAKGRFEFFAPPGSYNVQLNGVWEQRRRSVQLEDQNDIEVNLVDSRPEKSVLKGRVVLKSDPSHGVPEARVEGVATAASPGFADHLSVVADEEGKFEVNRSEIKMLIWAGSGSLAGAVDIAPEDKTVVIPLAPMGAATGILLDAATDKPAPNRHIHFGVRLPTNGGPFTWYFGQEGTTDASGRFSVKKLTVGLKHDVYVEMERNEDGPISWQTVSEFVPKNADQADLGELKLPGPYRAPTLEKLISKAMDVKKPLAARLQGDCYEARLFENYVLILAGSPKDAACRRFFSILYRRDTHEGDGEARDTLDNFRLLALDVSRPERAAELKKFLSRSDAPSFSVDDTTFAIVDTEGHLVVATTAKKLWPDKSMDAKALTAFLKQHLPPMPDAQKRLSDALAQARRENKRVLVEESAAWCGWCHVLAKYLDKHRSLVEKDYVWITIDPTLCARAGDHQEASPQGPRGHSLDGNSGRGGQAACHERWPGRQHRLSGRAARSRILRENAAHDGAAHGRCGDQAACRRHAQEVRRAARLARSAEPAYQRKSAVPHVSPAPNPLKSSVSPG